MSYGTILDLIMRATPERETISFIESSLESRDRFTMFEFKFFGRNLSKTNITHLRTLRITKVKTNTGPEPTSFDFLVDTFCSPAPVAEIRCPTLY